MAVFFLRELSGVAEEKARGFDRGESVIPHFDSDGRRKARIIGLCRGVPRKNRNRLVVVHDFSVFS